MAVDDGMHQEFLTRYRLLDESFDENEVKKLIKQSTKKAEARYLKLKEKPVAEKEVYISGWVREELGKNINRYALVCINREGEHRRAYRQVADAIEKYFSINGDLGELVLDPRRSGQLFGGEYKNRVKKWSALDLPVAEMEKKFAALVKARIQLIKTVNKLGYVEFRLKEIGATNEDYRKFVRNIDRVIEEYNREIPEPDDLPEWFYAEFNLPCLVCRLNNFPFDSLDQVVEYFADHYPLIKKNKNKIKIKVNKEEGDWMRYVKEKDCFEIFIDEYKNTRHQAMSLIHELSHVVAFLDRFSKGMDWMAGGKYEAEKEAVAVEKKALINLSDQLYGASLVDRLLSLRQTLFELKIHQEPDQDLSKLYAVTFNRCFEGAKQGRNYLYLLNRSVIMKPLRSLPHCLAMTASHL